MKKLITIGLIASVLLFITVILVFPPGQSLRFTVIPSDAQVNIDGKPATVSKSYKIRTGTHNLEISRSGFEAIKVPISKDTSSNQLYTLTPSSAEGNTWLVNHPAEAQTREGAGGAAFTKAGTAVQSQNKLITELPFVLSNLRIDYGNQTNGQLAIYITAATVRDRSEAVQLIRRMNYDPSDYVILFRTPEGDIR